jgi:DNA-binding transcriptional regulator GbsR (MarR family)
LTEIYDVNRLAVKGGLAVRHAMATRADPTDGAEGARLSPPALRFVLHWGEMGTRWGVNRTVAQIQALLYFHGRPFHADEIVELLEVARSNVSTSLRDLQSWNLVRVVHRLEDRRDFYETSRDPWDLMRVIVRERKAREFEPTITALRDCVGDPAFAREEPAVQARVRETLHLLEAISAWTDDMLRLPSSTLLRLLRMGARIQALLTRARPRPRERAAA